MTNEEIKNKLQRGLALTVKESWDLYKYIEALEQQTCDDCISREAIRNVLIRDNEMNGYSDRTYNLMEKLFDLPSVTPKPKSGKWIDIGATHSQCDKCLAVFEIVSVNGEANYCPNCGADMRESEEWAKHDLRTM